MISEKFRYQLRKEALQWHTEGLIDADTHNKLAIRYQLDELDSASRDRFVTIVLGVGVVM